MLNVPPAIPRFAAPAQVLQGPGSLSALRGLTAASVVVISRSESAATTACELLRVPTAEWVRPSWSGEPTVKALAGTCAALERLQPDWIIAIGGGSVLDGAKLTWILYEQPEQTFVVRMGAVAIGKLRSRARFIAVPTTSGSGSEMSSAAVFTNGSAKRPCLSPDLIPDVAILDGRLLSGVPSAALAASAMDALAHAVEGFTSRMRNPFVDTIALGAAAAIFSTAQRVVADPADTASAQQLLTAAAHAGLVQNHRIPGLGHAIAHQLASLGIPHGLANAILLPHVVRRNAADSATASGYAQLAAACRLGDTFESLAHGIEQLRHNLGLPERLGDLTNSSCDVSAIAAGALDDICARGNPTPMTAEAVTAVVQAAWS